MKKYILLTLSFCLALICTDSVAQNSLAVTVFEDVDGNGLEDVGEPTIPGILTTSLQLWEDVNMTGAIDAGDVLHNHDGGIGGVYTFGTGNTLNDAGYILEYIETPGIGEYRVTKLVGVVGVSDMDNDLNPVDNTAGFGLLGDTPETFIDLGLVIPGNIGSFVWHDIDGDGIQDGGLEVGIDGVDVTLIDAMTSVAVTVDVDGNLLTNPANTMGGGMYSFDNLQPGQYIVQFSVPNPSPEDWYPTQVTVNSDADDPTDDSDAENNSAAANYLQSHTIILLSDETNEEDRIDAGFFQAAIIGDFVWEDLNGNGVQDVGEPGIDGLTVSLFDDMGAPAIGADGLAVPDAFTAGGGLYQFMLVAPGDYQVQFNLPAPIGGVDWYPTEFDPADDDTNDPETDSDANNDPLDFANYLKSHVINIESGEMAEETRIDAGFWLPARVGDNVFCDENGNGIDDDGVGGVGGVDVRLINTTTGLTAQDADGINLTTTTVGGGMYQFELVPPGLYILEFSFNASVPDPPFVFTAQDDPDGLGDDFIDSDVDPDPFGGAFGQTAQFEVVSQDTEEEMKWDAGVYQTIQIEGTIWLESDMNNTNDAGEAGPTGVMVELIDANNLSKIDDVLTNAGEYSFDDVAPGEYIIQFDVIGTSIETAISCPGSNNANDMVDNDDNGPDGVTMVQSTPITLLSNCDPSTPPLVNYVDFCYFFDCSGNGENSLASTVCENIQPTDIICDINVLGSFCYVMPTGDVGGNQPSPLCPGQGNTVANNISWFAFVAYGGNYEVTVTPSGCTDGTNGQPGVQLGLYTDCNFNEAVYCDGGCSINSVTFDSSILEPGQTYYFFIDGCAGSVCNYEVTIDGSPVLPDLEPDNMCINDNGALICDDASYCPNTDVLFEATGIDLTVDFTWSITTQAGGPFTGDSAPMTPDQFLTLNFENEGVYEVCLDLIDNGCQIWNDGICRVITIKGLDDEMFEEVFVCEEEDFTDPSILMPMDPNGDGTIGWQGGNTFVEGINTFSVTTLQGCTYEQEFVLSLYPESDKGEYTETLCLEDLDPPLMIDALNITQLSFTGQTTFQLLDYQMINESDVNGCDTIIDINLEVLQILDGSIVQGACLPEGIILEFQYNTDLDFSTDISFYTFEWFDPDGNPLDDNVWNDTDPIDNLAPVGIGSGEYTLVITITKNGVTCTFPYSIVIDFETELPVDPNISGPGFDVCEADSIVTYSAIDFGDAFSFTWTYPADVAEATLANNAQELTINWSGSAGGEITLISANACGNSGPATITINVIPQATPTFDLGTQVCVDSCTIIEFTGDTALVASYVWDFDGGIEQNGTGSVGPGPHCVSWEDDGEKTISLTFTDTLGCVSTLTTEMITVIEPIAPPIVGCNSQLGEVTFSWDLLPGTVEGDYSVEVTSGPMGTLDGTTYTITGLDVEEQVDIILTILTGDACVQITTTGSCVAQDCIPPMVSISAPGDVISYCLDGTDQSFDLIENIPMGSSGSGVFMGTGIIDTLAGTFNPDSAFVGINTIFYTFFTTDGCIAPAQINIEVLETPVASFFSDVDTICITDVFNLTYDGTAGVNEITWDYGVDGMGTDGVAPVVTYTSSGNKTIQLTVTKDGCPSEIFPINVFVQAELDIIDVNCSIQEIDQVGFSWNSVAGATGYSVSVDGAPPFITSGTTYGETGLNPGDSVIVSVMVLTDSRCGGSMDTDTCIAQACPTFEISITPIDDQCIDGTNPIIPLVATADGNGMGTFSWSGPNVTGDQFDPNDLADGTYEIIAVYDENSCQGDSSIFVNITNTPTAAFSVDSTTICIGSTVTILYEGSPVTNQDDITWSPAGLVVAGANPNEYTATFDTEGTFPIQLDVVNGNCTTDSVVINITVEPELDFGEITCMEELNQITFTWDAVDCASGYEVYTTTDMGSEVFQGTQSTTQYLASGLMVGQDVTIRVIAVSECVCGNAESDPLTCRTKECTEVMLSLNTMQDTEFCIADDLSTIEISADPQGTDGNGSGTWSGSPAIDQNGIFDPVLAGVGTHTLVYEWLESEDCLYVDSITFIINDVPDVTSQFDQILCFDQETTMLEVMPTGGTGPFTVTLNGDAAELINDVSAGTYDIIVTDENLCTASTSVTITTPEEPMPVISGATELILGDSSNYEIQSALFDGLMIDSIVWLANGTEICNDSLCFSLGDQAPTETTVYEVSVFYNGECSVTAAALTVTVIEIEPPSIVEIANIFSPNNDGVNDEWQIISNDASVVINSIQVFDRWGNRVWGFNGPFDAKGNTVVWDGKYKGDVLQPGVYVYFIDLIQNDRQKIRSGDLTIIN